MIPVIAFIDEKEVFEDVHINAYQVKKSLQASEDEYHLFLIDGECITCKGAYKVFISRMNKVLKG